MTPAERRRRKRLAEVVRLREQGWSLRVIARHLEVHWQTVANDLARWAEESAKVSKLPVPNSTPSVENPTAEFDTEGTIVRLRKRA